MMSLTRNMVPPLYGRVYVIRADRTGTVQAKAFWRTSDRLCARTAYKRGHGERQVSSLDWFRQVYVETRLESVRPVAFVRQRRQGGGRFAETLAAEGTNQHVAILSGHGNVDEQHIAGRLLDRDSCIGSRSDGCHMSSTIFERGRHHLSGAAVVIDDEHADAVEGWHLGFARSDFAGVGR